MIRTAQAEIQTPTIWGLTPDALHERFWAARGVQVVRHGDATRSIEFAELYLLTPADQLVMFKLRDLVDLLSWVKPQLLAVRLEARHETNYTERALTDARGRFTGFRRSYPRREVQHSYVYLTRDRQLAQWWRDQPADLHAPGRKLRRRVDRHRLVTSDVRGRSYDTQQPEQIMRFVHDLVELWEQPDATIRQLRREEAKLWRHETSTIDPSARIVNGAWVGAGRELQAGQTVAGPAVLWDSPDARPPADPIPIIDIEPTQTFARRTRVSKGRPRSRLSRWTKRLFDIGFATCAIAATLPLYPFVMLAIWLEDGRPFFFAHKRETLGGREFPCVKFRTMYNDADARLAGDVKDLNRADGPQVFIDPDADPRVTRVGRLLRKLQIDEFPQFFNVLVGQMSIVGPRPSPRKENQYCPAWREARLRVRPGITGLWQVSRTRQADLDFQEWIRYDLEYVQNTSWRMDLWIIGQTIADMISRSQPTGRKTCESKPSND